MITRVRIQNYRSFVDAEVKLRPFSLVVGANGSGKSNLLKAFTKTAGKFTSAENKNGKKFWLLESRWQRHVNSGTSDAGISVWMGDQRIDCHVAAGGSLLQVPANEIPWKPESFAIYNINSEEVSGIETVVANAAVSSSGKGTAQVLETLKSGDREDLFEKIEASFKRLVPEVDKLSLRTVEQGKKQIQVREKGLKEPLPATELSEGTRLVLCILTILHQENPPPIILLEDIDRGLHPRLFEHVAPMMKDIAEKHQINIIATTHNPYLVDCFQDDKEAVIIVEKKDGASTLTSLADKLEGLDYDKVDPDDMPLGNLWFSGLVGGVPQIFKSNAKA